MIERWIVCDLCLARVKCDPTEGGMDYKMPEGWLVHRRYQSQGDDFDICHDCLLKLRKSRADRAEGKAL